MQYLGVIIFVISAILFLKNKAFNDNATPDFKRRRSCYGADGKKKNAYTTEDVALAQAKRQKIPLRCYECPDCGYYHLTKNL